MGEMKIVPVEPTGETITARARNAPEGGDVKPLDLSNLLKHAFFAGFLAMRNEAAEDDDPLQYWVEYNPDPHPAYGRIRSAFVASPEQGEVVRELVEAIKDAIRRCEEWEHINVVGRGVSASKAGTLRNIANVLRAALAKIGDTK